MSCAPSPKILIWKRTAPWGKKYPELFQVARGLRGQRDILTHRYGLPSSAIDWSLVWATFDYKLENVLLPSLDKAIEDEENEEDEDEGSGNTWSNRIKLIWHITMIPDDVRRIPILINYSLISVAERYILLIFLVIIFNWILYSETWCSPDCSYKCAKICVNQDPPDLADISTEETNLGGACNVRTRWRYRTYHGTTYICRKLLATSM